MRINIYTLKKILEDVLVKKGFSEKDANFIANDYWRSEIGGKTTHGVVKFLKELQYLTDKQNSPEIITDNKSMVLVDAHREVGSLAAKYSIDLLIKRAKRYGLAIVGMKNAQRYGALNHWALYIAKADLIGIVINSCEPASTAYGGVSPILGTNPLAIGVPTSSDPIVLDMATSKASMSRLLLSMYGQPLPRKTFFDSKGNYTLNPKKVRAVEHFGGYKGYGLALMLQILAGSLVIAKMGSKIKTHYDIGYYFQAIDPSVFQDIKSFKKQNDNLVAEIKKSKRKIGTNIITIPGERSKTYREIALHNREIEISEKLYGLLIKEIR